MSNAHPMKKFSFILFLSFFALSSVNAELNILPFKKNSFSEIKAARKDNPFILVFWSESCRYCLKELAMFGKLLKQYPAIELITVATDNFLDEGTVHRVLKQSKLDLKQTWVFSEPIVEKIYASVKPGWLGELPATHFFTRDNQEIRHMGIVKEGELIQWLNEQTQ